VEIVAGVHQLKIPFPEGMERFTNAYVIEGSKGNILVDCGWDSSEAVWAFREELRLERLSFDDINWIVVTHVHPDHFGLAAKLRELCGAKIVMHPLEDSLIDSRYVDYRQLAGELEEMLVSNGVPSEEAARMREASARAAQFVTPTHPDVLVEDGDTISNGTFQLEILHTPGHSPGHICLYDARKRRLFCGDHVVFDAVPRIGVHPQSGSDPAGDYARSLEYVLEKPVSFVFPGHGPVFNSLTIRSEEILRQHATMQRQIAEVLDDGLKTACDIAREIGWRTVEGDVSYDDLGFRERRAAVCEVIAWLRRLVEEGRVAALERNGTTTYLSK
jgi:glyoxylase-like metal-dependent hydrolase (beta-lactamase superfamily II)